MRIAVIGGGPGGLYFAYLWKRRHPDAMIDLFEQNPAGATWGFGVVFSDQALEFLRADDPETVDAITPRMESWSNITLNLRGESVEIDGVGFSSIGRLELLTILQARVRAAGVTPRYDTLIQSVDELDGLRPDRRGRRAELAGAPRLSRSEFGASVSHSTNKFAWYGTTKRFATLSQTFVKTELGTFNAHHYRYSPDMSTFLVECDAATWQAYGFEHKTHRAVAGDLRAGVCRHARRPSAGLEQIGVAQFSLDLERALVARQHGADRRRAAFGAFLDRLGHAARDRGRDRADQGAGGGERIFPPALARYEAERKPIVKKLVTAARTSADWYEHFPEHMKLDLMDFAYSYITRSGRIDDARLRAMSPAFMARYEASKRAGAGMTHADRRSGAAR